MSAAAKLTPSRVRLRYNATANKADPRRWRRQIRIFERAILRRDPTLWAPRSAKYLRAFYATTRGTLIRGAATVVDAAGAAIAAATGGDK